MKVTFKVVLVYLFIGIRHFFLTINDQRCPYNFGQSTMEIISEDPIVTNFDVNKYDI